MDVDAAQYASISREMFNNHQYLQVLYNGENYLDKPPLLFWLSAISFKIFGINTVAYKLPSFLFTLLGVYSTYRLASRLYDIKTGTLAALILYTCQAFFLFNNDVRTDTILTGASVFAAWQLLVFYDTDRFRNLILGFTGIAFAMMAKGPIGAIVPASAIGVHLFYRRDWKKLFNWKWLAGITWGLLLMAPMLWGLYEQYGGYGPKFFFWIQSFGRITGVNTWENNTGYFFFVHTFLWAFLPWSPLTVVALFSKITELFKTHFVKNTSLELFSFGGFLLPFFALSFSHYKLPHYIFILFPYAAIMCGNFLYGASLNQVRTFRILFPFQYIIMLLLWISVIILCIYIFPIENAFKWAILAFILAYIIYCWRGTENNRHKFIVVSALTMVAINFILNAHIYPALLKYQSGSMLAKIAVAKKIPDNSLVFYKDEINSFEFYYGSIIPVITAEELKNKIERKQSCWILGNDDLIESLKENNTIPSTKIEVNDFPITKLNFYFLNPSKRQTQLRKKYLVAIM